MNNSIEFKGLKHYPLGDANLEIVDGKLSITNLSSSGFDGVLIDTESKGEWHLKFDPIEELTAGQALSVQFLGVDNRNRVKTKGEIALSYNTETELPEASVNSWLLPDVVTLVGYLDGEVVYSEDYTVPRGPETNYWQVLLFLLKLLMSASFEYKHKKITDPDGRVTTEEEWTFDVNTSRQGTVPNGDEIEVDTFAVKLDREYPEGTSDSETAPVTAVAIRATGISEMTLVNEIY